MRRIFTTFSFIIAMCAVILGFSSSAFANTVNLGGGKVAVGQSVDLSLAQLDKLDNGEFYTVSCTVRADGDNESGKAYMKVEAKNEAFFGKPQFGDVMLDGNKIGYQWAEAELTGTDAYKIVITGVYNAVGAISFSNQAKSKVSYSVEGCQAVR